MSLLTAYWRFCAEEVRAIAVGTAAIAFFLALGLSFAVAQTTAKPAIKPKPEPFTTGSSPAPDLGTTPNVGSPQWKKEQAENERKEEQLKKVINSICRGC
jgi:hypothetical protein